MTDATPKPQPQKRPLKASRRGRPVEVDEHGKPVVRPSYQQKLIDRARAEREATAEPLDIEQHSHVHTPAGWAYWTGDMNPNQIQRLNAMRKDIEQ